MDKLSNEQVEGWVLGAIMAANEAAHGMLQSSGLTPEDLTNETNRALFSLLRALADRRKPCDAKSVAALAVGLPNAYEFARGLQVAGGSISKEAFSTHAEELRRLGMLRKLRTFHQLQLKTIDKSANPTELAKAVSDFSAQFVSTTEPDASLEKPLSGLMESWDAYERGERLPFIPTGIDVLDNEFGGFVPNLNVIGGMESVGKSALVGTILGHLISSGTKVGLFGLEDGVSWLVERLVARDMMIPVEQVGASKLDECRQELLTASMEKWWRLSSNIVIHDQAGINTDTLVAKCKRWILQHGVKAIFVDHGGEIEHRAGIARDRFDLAVKATYERLRNIAVNYQVPVIVLVHFNRETDRDQGGVPKTINFAESQYIARMIRLGLGLWEKPGRPEELRCTILKRTKGRRNVTFAIPRDVRYALVKRTGGREVDLAEERSQEEEASRQAMETAKRARQAETRSAQQWKPKPA